MFNVGSRTGEYVHSFSRLNKVYKWLYTNMDKIDVAKVRIHKRYRKNRKGNMKVVGYYVVFNGYLPSSEGN